MLKNSITKILEENGIIIFPTDTVYGMGVLPKKEALKKVYEIKKRDVNKKIVALVSSKEMAKSIIQKDFIAYKLIDKFFPGAFTLISKGKEEFLNKIGYSEDIGVRMPNNKIALKIIEEAGGILMTTSVNLSGEKAAISIYDIDENIANKVDLIIENENEKISKKASSIFKILDGNISLIREGDISLEEVLKYKEEINFERENS